MWEPDDVVIHQLRLLYFTELPKQIAGAKDDSARKECTERRSKVAHLLQFGYGEELSQADRSWTSHAYTNLEQSCATIFQETAIQRRTEPVGHSSIALTQRLQREIEPETLDPELKDGTGSGRSRAERRKASREEDHKAITKLRQEYQTAIQALLSKDLSDGDRARLLARRENVRRLLERGYHITLEKS